MISSGRRRCAGLYWVPIPRGAHRFYAPAAVHHCYLPIPHPQLHTHSYEHTIGKGPYKVIRPKSEPGPGSHYLIFLSSVIFHRVIGHGLSSA